MCILFMYVSNHSASKFGVSRSPYKLILASNRDEKFSRPTKPACFWESSEDSNILAGQDLEELGTWLGISKSGKLAAVLNIMNIQSTANSTDCEYLSRGSLVTGFLRSPPGLPGCTYLKNLCHLDISKKYRPFHLITVDLFDIKTVDTCTETGNDSDNCRRLVNDVSTTPTATQSHPSACVTYLTNQNQINESSNGSSGLSLIKPKHMSLPADTDNFLAFGNSVFDKPFKKVECGKVEFQNILTRYCENSRESHSKDSLVEELLQFLKSTEKHFPDEIIEEQAKGTKIPKGLLPNFSSRFVRVPGVDYGTRTHTIVLVDMNNNVTFHEWTMKQPISQACPEWSHSEFTFTLTSPA